MRAKADLLIGAMLVGGMAALSCSMVSCIGSTKVETRSTTIGQELEDLDDARNKGLITEDEYAKKRQEIMKRK